MNILYTLTIHFIRYWLIPGWRPFHLQNCLNSYRFNKVLEIFVRDFGPYWHNSVTQLLEICQLHMWSPHPPPLRPPKVQRCCIKLGTVFYLFIFMYAYIYLFILSAVVILKTPLWDDCEMGCYPSEYVSAVVIKWWKWVTTLGRL